ncbi:Os03g0438000 [Oryza sativa Japonica Group]|uniref:Expressed protein n=2 Tax=Oryza sativa subsp. japonica TaxID=39947 RepID=Q10J18_ORYSJ|nr:expressed protein [Oryza sativa Japonica Group]BAF12360.1 Os03g0438000 [Oryza sativa Japonica Group]BAG99830.1 unnamed protein product [Oryza sativa Japonica Group]BAS84855.1 Os03g0438000 [Oryza sativa Japonica Group]|eukprot:NP_001050446.1 Os03g0438000 [Oryza sativa Japonica Group]
MAPLSPPPSSLSSACRRACHPRAARRRRCPRPNPARSGRPATAPPCHRPAATPLDARRRRRLARRCSARLPRRRLGRSAPSPRRRRLARHRHPAAWLATALPGHLFAWLPCRCLGCLGERGEGK